MQATTCNNPSCGKEITQYTGRRPKKYCSVACRNAHYKVLFPSKKKENKIDPLKLLSQFKFEIMYYDSDLKIFREPTQEELMSAMAKFKATDQQKKARDYAHGKSETPTDANAEIQAQIKSIQSEKIPAHRDTIYGRKSWAIEQQARIDELKKKLQ